SAPSEQPRSPAEAALTELFAGVLEDPQLGPADNFFTSGGNSLQAMRLVGLIARQTGHDLSPAAIFLHPTPRALPTPLAAGPSNPSSLIPLTAELSKPPLVLIHAIGGTVFDYAQLATDLTGAFAVYGLQSPGLTQPGQVQAVTVADLATRYIDL